MRTAHALPPFLLATLVVAGCSGTSATDAGQVLPDARPPEDAGLTCPTLDGAVVQLSTEDGETLEADLYTTGAVAGPAVVLLHMIPPGNDRSNYPADFIGALTGRGITVLNVDRRGAGNSTGVAREAYTGDNGKFDAKAAVDFLRNHACAPAPDRIAIVGASNGTTTALDYTIYAAAEASAPAPKALVFLTGGAYTETNNQISAHRDLLDGLPIQFVFSTAERAWSAGFQAGAPAAWRFEELDPGDHGTRMFSRRPESVATVADFLQATLQ